MGIFDYIAIGTSLVGLAAVAATLWKRVKTALKEQNEFVEALDKFVKKVTLALADKKVDNDEIEGVMKEFVNVHKEGKELVEAYIDVGEKMSELITKAKNKVSK